MPSAMKHFIANLLHWQANQMTLDNLTLAARETTSNLYRAARPCRPSSQSQSTIFRAGAIDSTDAGRWTRYLVGGETKMHIRIVQALGLFFALFWSTASNAAFYYVDLNNPVGILTSPTAYGIVAPTHASEHAFLTPVLHFNIGDVVDFGSVTIEPLFGGDGRYQQITLYVIPPDVAVSYDPSTPPNPFNIDVYYSASCFDSCDPPPPPNFDSQTFDLRFTVKTNTIQLGFSGDFSYYPPSVSAVPELSTWAMMLIGFAALGFASYRKSRRFSITSSPHPQWFLIRCQRQLLEVSM
jgi:hypothetical protein